MKNLIKVVAAGMMLGAGLVVNDDSIVTKENEAKAYKFTTYSNCREFNKKYPKGVKKSKTTKDKRFKNGRYYYAKSPAKTSAAIYKKAQKKNPNLDRDKDGIACEN